MNMPMKFNFVYILEGVNGTGKTTLSRLLSRHYGGAPIIRPFHNQNPNSHWGQTMDTEERNLRAMGVPIQTPADDMYVADMLMKMQPRVAICDRSLITGMSYGDFDEEPRRATREWALEYWAGMLTKHHKATLVHLVADYDTCKQRCQGEGRRPHRERDEWDQLTDKYAATVEAASKLMDRTVIIDTSVLDASDALKAVIGLD